MGVLMLIFLICATRINAVYVVIFATLTLVFVFLSAAYWRLAVADALVGNRLIVAAGASLFVASMLGFYLLVAQLFDSVGFPLRLPVGDLSCLWDRRVK
jgi:succinate-acetate transporter protein